MTDELRQCLFRWGAKRVASTGVYRYSIHKGSIKRYVAEEYSRFDDIHRLKILEEIRDNYSILETHDSFTLTDDCRDIIDNGIAFGKL